MIFTSAAQYFPEHQQFIVIHNFEYAWTEAATLGRTSGQTLAPPAHSAVESPACLAQDQTHANPGPPTRAPCQTTTARAHTASPPIQVAIALSAQTEAAAGPGRRNLGFQAEYSWLTFL